MIITIGGTGFIGKHLAVLLHRNGIANISLSREPDIEFTRKFAPSMQTISIQNLENELDEKKILAAKSLVYLASNSVPSSESNTISREIENNVIPAISNIDKLLSVNPDLRIIYLSSGGTVYGPGHRQPICEDEPSNPVTPYAFGKITIENYIKYLGSSRGVKYTILRASNPVGKWHRNPKQGFIGASIAKIRAGEAVQLYGTGKIVRDYIDADELAEAILQTATRSSLSNSQILNVGSGIGTSLNHILDSFRDILGKELHVENHVGRLSDLSYNVLNCSRIKSELGWQSSINVDQIVKKMWQETACNNKD
jgi:UDP-glucose 4-epimerase